MSDNIDVIVTLGYASSARDELHSWLTAPIPGCEGQALDHIAGNHTHPDGLPMSGQAGALNVYGGLLRRGSSADVIKHLRAAPWGGVEGVLVVHETYGPATVERFGYQPELGW